MQHLPAKAQEVFAFFPLKKHSKSLI